MELSQTLSALDSYMRQVKQSSHLLTKEEEYEVSIAAKNGDLRAKNRMIESNLRLVINVAKHYQYSDIPLIDIIQEGNTGLIRAVEKFDATQGFRFSTYAVWWIKNHIDRSIMNNSRTIRIPINIAKIYKRINKAANKLKLDLANYNDLIIIAKSLEMDINDVTDTLSNYVHVLNLDENATTESGSVTTLVNIIEDKSITPPSSEFESGSTREYLLALLESLPNFERRIIELRFGLTDEPPLSLLRIGERLSVSREKVRISINKSLIKLKPQLLRDNMQRHDYIL
ncbi:sigma-70 family RNA polymerase sigma factor [Moritella sp. 24]|uniref:sigma-70 family RNA polymerase sigma factor n=1 Tax=Moritella sp. 24 TaxID=2746230 RepID=UPI001BAA2B4E|nr:sigma-70 family RNA polymerase sigma factor [Moritella sp. 24]QUM77796.1 sigma-70 family RNA polymerase sigma factor [Moritella sp. 24]